MPLRNLDWYNLNCTRPYPLDDQATLIDVNGRRLAHNFIADLNLLIPRGAGRYVHVGGISLGKSLATVTFVASEDPFDATNFTPVAAVSVPSPEKYVHYAVEPLYPGVGGWVVWGTAIDQNELRVHKFVSGRQSLLLPRAARFYNDFPIATMGKLYGAALTGLISLSGGNDIEIVKECIALDGYPAERDALQCDDTPGQEDKREVIVIRLKDKRDKGNVTLPVNISAEFTSQENLFKRYSGCCGGRPESNTCGSPEPIETVNAVDPDCCGAITLRFTGCAKLTHVVQETVLDDVGDEVLVDDACGVVVDCGLDLAESCPTDTLPAIDGTRRWETNVLCMSESLSASVVPILDDTPDEDIGSSAWSPTLPFQENFLDPIDGSWTITQGFWGSRFYRAIEVPGLPRADRQCWGTWAENCFAVRNTLIWEGNVGSYWRKSYAELTPIVDDAGSNEPRFGIVFNHRETFDSSGIYEWWSLELTRGHFHLLHFDGTAEHIIYEGQSAVFNQNVAMFFGVSLFPHYYSEAQQPGGATLYARWAPTRDLGDLLAIAQQIGPIYLENFAPETGNFGITAKNCHVAATNFEVQYSGTPGYP